MEGIEQITFTAEFEGIDEEMNKSLNDIKARIPRALNLVGSEMTQALLIELERTWHDTYEPKVYVRRSDSNGGEIGIMNPQNMTYETDGTTLHFDYSPSGETGQRWLDFAWDEGGQRMRPIPTHSLHERDGDELIEWIQTSHTIFDSEIPARPFWNMFLDGQEFSAVRTFMRAMESADYIVKWGMEDMLDLSESKLYAEEFNPFEEMEEV